MPGKFIKKVSSKKEVVPENNVETSEKFEPPPEKPYLDEKTCEETPSRASGSDVMSEKKPLQLSPITNKGGKKKKGKESRERLKKKRANKHAVLIQSKWRGHAARLTISERKAQKEKEKTLEPDPDNAEEEKLADFKKIPFASIKRAQFYVDNAVGLPVNCTATRVSCRLLKQDRTPLSEAGESFSDPSSPVSSPEFDLFMTWKASSLNPSSTLLCRVDTLDRVSLEPKTVGYAALKLCSLADGTQPTSDDIQPQTDEDNVFLNAGLFKLPILLGKLPDWCPLTEERLEDLPVIPNAFLTVRLFDAAAEEPPKHLLQHDNDENCDGSVATLLYATYDNPKVANRLREKSSDIPLWDDLGADIKLGKDIDEEDWVQLRPAVKKWLQTVFPAVSEMRKVINPNYTLRFRDTDDAGLMASLDMLYNMPIVKSRELPPNTIVGYKVVVQYLRGSKSPWPEEAGTENDPRYFLDDFSQTWDFESSTHRCPVYTDDFKLVTNMHFGPNACMLLIVTRVDITFTTESTFDLKMPFRNPLRSWWGLLPLRASSPFYSPEGSTLEKRDFDGAFVNAGAHQVPLFQGTAPVAILESDNPMETLLNSLKKAEAEYSSGGCPCFNRSDVLPHDGVAPDEFDEPMFSVSGASAIVRIQDSRLIRFAPEHIKVETSTLPNTNVMNLLLESQSKASSRKTLFAYDAFKYDLEKPISHEMLGVILEKPSLLLDTINFKSEADCLEYVDNIQ